jgi:hypothetical protein
MGDDDADAPRAHTAVDNETRDVAFPRHPTTTSPEPPE